MKITISRFTVNLGVFLCLNTSIIFLSDFHVNWYVYADQKEIDENTSFGQPKNSSSETYYNVNLNPHDIYEALDGILMNFTDTSCRILLHGNEC